MSARLLGCIEDPDFATLHWGKAPLHESASQDLSFGLENFWELLSEEAPYVAGCVRLSRARSREHDNRQTLDLARSAVECRRALQDGLSVTCNHVQRFLHPAEPLLVDLRGLARAAGVPEANIQLAGFYSAPHARAFGAHTDPNHVFSVQVHGEKTWELGEGEDARVVVMRPGDVLYVPKNHPHAVLAGDSESLSMNYILKTLSWSSVVEFAVSRFIARSGHDEDLPWGWLVGEHPPLGPDWVREAVQGLGRQAVEESVIELGQRVLPHMPVGPTNLSGMRLADLNGHTVVCRAWEGRLRLVPVRSGVRVVAPGLPELTCPDEVISLLMALGQSESCIISELPGDRPLEGKLMDVRRLVGDGYICVPAGTETSRCTSNPDKEGMQA